MRFLNLDGDQQADLSVHGGQNKAVYAYPAEHYEHWHREVPDVALPWGMFGENLTTEGLLEHTVQVGDRFRVGSTEVVVTQPRVPCLKLSLKFGRDDIRVVPIGRPVARLHADAQSSRSRQRNTQHRHVQLTLNHLDPRNSARNSYPLPAETPS